MTGSADASCVEIRRRYRTIGVTGHIDHGKTSLVKALSGVDTDTHPEEKRRGITIDLGFASFQCGDYQFALIDAPGHQKYIGNLLAGVAGVDLGLLIVACDQGLQEQTYEHAFVLRMLAVNELIVVLTRRDLVDDQRERDVREEVGLLVDDLGFRNVTIVGVSALTGAGMSELKAALCDRASGQHPHIIGRSFRMPVDRVLSMPGRGCVLGGTVWSGSVSVGDTLELASTGQLVRVRDLQRHGVPGQTSGAGLRTAINIVGELPDEMHRGDELLQPGCFRPSTRLLVELETRSSIPSLDCPLTLQLHTATSSCTARLLGHRQIKSKQVLVAVLETAQPIIAIRGQRFLARLPYPLGTFGGGRVLAALDVSVRASQRTRHLLEFGRKLQSSLAVDRLIAWVDELGEITPTELWLETVVGLDEPAESLSQVLQQLITAAVDMGRVIHVRKLGILLSVDALERSMEQLRRLLRSGQSGSVKGDGKVSEKVSGEVWRSEASAIEQLKAQSSEALIRHAIDELVNRGELIRLSNMIALAGGQQLTAKQRQALESLLRLYENNRTPPTHAEAAQLLSITEATLKTLSRFGLQSGVLIDIGSNIYYWKATFDTLCEELSTAFRQTPELTVATIRDHWSITRKHAIPLLEYLDKIGLTKRNGDKRSPNGPPLAAT